MWDTLKEIFAPSRSLKKVDFYTLRAKIADWSKHQSYPSYASLPSIIRFPSEFWSRINEIARHTSGDGHERAVTVWWADKEFVVTENVRGETDKILIPKQEIYVRYNPIAGTNRAERIITVNNDVYSKRSLSIHDMQRIKKVEVQFLFNMHTHPPHVDPVTNQKGYAFFSSVDLKGFLTSPAAITGLVTDVLWILVKTSKSPRDFDGELSLITTPEMLTKDLGLKVYRAEFGQGAFVQCPELGFGYVDENN